MDDLDFSQTGGGWKKPAPPPAQPQAPIYVAAIARAFFESVGKEETVPAGTVFFAENEKASRILLKRDKMYLLVDGEVTLSARGKPLGAVKLGHIFGEMAAISDSPRSATAVARSACRVIALDDRQFYSALQKTPQFALMMLGVMIQRLRSMQASFSGVPSSKTREARVFDKKLMATLEGELGNQARVLYQRGQVIMVAGQTAALMYVVAEGRVEISIRGALIERIGAGGVFGEMALIDQSPRSANAAAETDCALLAINRNFFLSLVKSDPAFGIALLSATAERVRGMAQSIG
jgi:CRP/FNR family transcriptional regulator, cyclic AMP receptor protein